MISKKDREILRDLARRQAALAAEDANAKRCERWFRHNDGRPEEPLVVVEYETFYHELRPVLVCESEEAREMEEQLRMQLSIPALIGDDRVIPDFYSVHLSAWANESLPVTRRQPESGASIGYQFNHPITDIAADIERLAPSTFDCDIDAARAKADAADDVIGDILPVKLRNNSLLWPLSLAGKAVQMMGMEAYFIAMYDEPEALHTLMAFLRDDSLRHIEWQEANGLLTPNWDNEHGGSNSFGFTAQLPKRVVAQADLRRGATDVRMADCWMNISAQETVGISRDCFCAFVMPYYKDVCARAGLVYYGCCEPVQDTFADIHATIPNLRKLSISAWCDEERIAEQLQGTGIVYSRKPSPNFLGVGVDLDEDAFRAYIQKTVRAAKGLPLEFIFRDIYTLAGNRPKLARAVAIVRECL